VRMVENGLGLRGGARLDREERGPLAFVVLISLALYVYHIWWGLPNGNVTWAVDAITPLTPLSIAQKSFLSGWNSGWFYFKYSIGHCLVLLVVYLPYIALLLLTGRSHGVSKTLRHLADSPHAISVLALLGRLTSAVMGAATVWLLYRVTRRLFGRESALWSAAAASVSLGMVFYSHTTNLDIPSLFWTVLAWDAALALVATSRLREMLVFGAAAAMAIATKEQAVGFLVGCTAILVVGQAAQWRRGVVSGVDVIRRLALGAGLGVFVILLTYNAFYNPLGFYRRLQFLTGRLPADVWAELVPRAAYISPGTLMGLQAQWDMFRESCWAMAWSMGFAWMVFALIGLAITLRRKPLAALGAMVPFVTYFFLSLPALPQPPNVRYVLQMTIALTLLGGVTSAMLWARGAAGKALVLAVLAYTYAGGVGVDYLLAHDPRYQVERWLAKNAAPGTRVETYHKPTFSPRFPANVNVVRPKFHHINTAEFEQRAPDMVLLNLVDLERITERYDKRDPVMVRPPENQEFLEALMHGDLGYHEVASFHTSWPLIPDGIMRSLSPSFVLLARRPA
jgi:hypothetical protein